MPLTCRHVSYDRLARIVRFLLLQRRVDRCQRLPLADTVLLGCGVIHRRRANTVRLALLGRRFLKESDVGIVVGADRKGAAAAALRPAASANSR